MWVWKLIQGTKRTVYKLLFKSHRPQNEPMVGFLLTYGSAAYSASRNV